MTKQAEIDDLRECYESQTDAEHELPTDHFGPDDIARLDNSAYVANKYGDRCGWALIGALTSHLRDVYYYDPLPWLRNDPFGAKVRRGRPGIYYLRDGTTVVVDHPAD